MSFAEMLLHIIEEEKQALERRGVMTSEDRTLLGTLRDLKALEVERASTGPSNESVTGQYDVRIETERVHERLADPAFTPRVTSEAYMKAQQALVDRILKTGDHDPVNAPKHYKAGDVYETILVLEAWGLNYHLGNTVKYISRAGKKGDIIEDLEKARWYLDREIERLKKMRTTGEATG